MIRNIEVEKGLRRLQNALKQLDKMGIVVLSCHYSKTHEMPIIEALHTDATQGLITLGKAMRTSRGQNKLGRYDVYGMELNGVYLRFIVREEL